MNKIREQHKFVIYSIFVVTASVYFFLSTSVSIASDVIDRLRFFGVSWPVIAGGAVFLYEKWGWKFFNPRLDFSGQWRFSEDQFILDAETGDHKFSYSASGCMTVVQDVRSVSIIEGQTKKKVEQGSGDQEISTWWSVSCDLNDTGSVLYCALDHKSAPGRKGGAVKYGVEVFSVKERDLKGRPVEMSSVVYHCIGAGVPHLVHVNYTRD